MADGTSAAPWGRRTARIERTPTPPLARTRGRTKRLRYHATVHPSLREGRPEKNCFTANLDDHGVNSGSPVFDAASMVVEGILVRGDTDFVIDGACMRSNVCSDAGCPGFEEASRSRALHCDRREVARVQRRAGDGIAASSDGRGRRLAAPRPARARSPGGAGRGPAELVHGVHPLRGALGRGRADRRAQVGEAGDQGGPRRALATGLARRGSGGTPRPERTGTWRELTSSIWHVHCTHETRHCHASSPKLVPTSR